MNKIAVVTDSTAAIPEVLLDKYKIHTVASYVHLGNEALRDLATIQRDEFYTWLKTATMIPKTANPSPGDYLSVYERLASEGIEEIVSIHMSSKMSGAYQAGRLALAMLNERFPNTRLEVIDSLNMSMCQGWIALEAARANLEGKSISEILALIQALIPKTRMLQTADTLKYLYMGGRIGKAKHLFGSLLDIKPLISMEDGLIVAVGTARTQAKAYQAFADIIERSIQGGSIKIAYVHAAAREEIQKLKQEIESRIPVVESIIAEYSPALGVHTGPGSTGLCYYGVSD